MGVINGGKYQKRWKGPLTKLGRPNGKEKLTKLKLKKGIQVKT